MAEPSSASVTESASHRIIRAVAATLEPYEAPDDDAGHRWSAAAGSPGGVLLAVSGGRDSAVLLHAAATAARGAVRAVATFDHGTGPHATDAAASVRASAAALGLGVVSGTAATAGRTEDAWREARWAFLRTAAADVGAAAVATAHTADDQIETIAMRVLRGAGPRGIAALAAASAGVVRPLVAVPRAVVAEYAAAHRLRWVEDPSNADPRHLRSRVRSALLPACERARPLLPTRLGAAAERAAAWRAAVEVWARAIAPDPARGAAVAALAALGPEALAVFWPAFAARGGVRLDRRGLERLVAFTGQVTERVRRGTVQPARVPVAPGAVVALHHAVDGTVRGWHLVVHPRSLVPRAASPERGTWRGGGERI